MAEPALEIGARAPAFTLANQDGRKVSLNDMRGHWLVLYFYPKDDTPGCTTADMTSLDFHRRRKPMFPFEDVDSRPA